MGHYIARRLMQMIPVVFGITLILFFMLRLIPGDPASVMLGERATDAAVARINHELGLDQPIYVQYSYFLRDLATLNLGTSIKYQVPVATLLGQRLLVSLSVVGVTLVLTIVIASEKLLPSRVLANRSVTSMLLVLALGVALVPARLPGLTIPGSQAAGAMRSMGMPAQQRPMSMGGREP